MKNNFGNKGAEATYKLRKGKTYAEIYGVDKAICIKRKQSESRKRYFELNPEAQKGEKHSMFGKHHSEKSKKLISRAMIGKLVGEKNPMKKGEAKRKIRIAREKYFKKNPDALKGSKNPAWKGGKSFEPYNAEFNDELKLSIRQRDGFSCQFCLVVENGKAFIPHHIDYDKKNNSKPNLILLCIPCNSKANADRKKWEFCFQTLMEIRGL